MSARWHILHVHLIAKSKLTCFFQAVMGKLLDMCSELSYKLLYNKFSFTTQKLPLIKM